MVRPVLLLLMSEIFMFTRMQPAMQSMQSQDCREGCAAVWIHLGSSVTLTRGFLLVSFHEDGLLAHDDRDPRYWAFGWGCQGSYFKSLDFKGMHLSAFVWIDL